MVSGQNNNVKRAQCLTGIAAVFFVCVACADAVKPQPATDPGNLLVSCGVLIDGIDDRVRVKMDVLIEKGKISTIGQDLIQPPATGRLDLSAYTCLPGFIDMHTHIMENPEDTADLSVYFGHTLQETIANGRINARKTLLAGFTTVRNLGVYFGFSSRFLREEINSGITAGPRMQIAGTYLTIPGGGGDLLTPGVREEDIPGHLRFGVARGEAQFRRKARLAVEQGADVLKIIASGAVLAYGGVPGAPEMTPEEIRAVVEVGHRAGIMVTAHAHGAESVKQAIRAGVDSIEHASLIDTEGMKLAKDNDVALSMDVYGGDWIAEEGRRQGWPEEFLRKNDETTLAQRENFRTAHALGVPIVFGSDAGIYPHGLNGRQFRYMVEWGMTPMQAIQAATSVAARYMGREDRVGSLQPRRYGDLVAVRGDPLADISVLENIDVVIKGGVVFKNR